MRAGQHTPMPAAPLCSWSRRWMPVLPRQLRRPDIGPVTGILA